MNNLLQSITKENIITLCVILAVVATVLLVIKFIVNKKRQPRYFVKDKLLTATEIKYYDAIRSVVGNNFLVLPQINLASVIDKEGETNFRNELFRNIDFAIFDYDFHPLVLIEINDNTHFRKDRIERDQKVLSICKKAGIPLVTFWVKDGLDVNYIANTLHSALRYQLSRKK